MVPKFNIRVYGISIRNGYVLLSDELFSGIKMTKFPGGGMDYGEGTIDCLKREFEEEKIGEITAVEHFYTTDFFQPALFFEATQLLSIYYRVEISTDKEFPFSEVVLDTNSTDHQKLRWTSIANLQPEVLTFPIDRVVAKLLKEGSY
jgi:8-oxo-dGTP diphosphatase